MRESTNNQGTRAKVIMAFSIILISAFVLSPTLQNNWVNWDDPAYVLENELIKELNSESISKTIKTSEVQGIYHPLTIISLAIDYQFWGLDAFGYHLSNLIIHLINVTLVFVLFIRLNSSLLVAGIVSLLFGLHPMHVESVAWISARKDVLYVFFYLLSVLGYLRFRSNQHQKKIIWLSISILFFICSILSKSIAFTLPAVLILIDFLLDGRLELKRFWNKTPYFILSGVAVFIAKFGQQASNSMDAMSQINFGSSLVIGMYNSIYYIFQAIIPINLAAFHPFSIDLSPTIWQYLAIIPFLGLTLILYYTFSKYKNVFFGLAFYVVTIAPLLQIIPFGKAESSERYTYLAYIGLFYCLAIGIEYLKHSKSKLLRKNIIGIGVIWLVFISLQTIQQSQKWKNSDTLWSQVIEVHPRSEWAYMSRGIYFAEIGNYQKALLDLNKSIELRPFAQSLYERGLILEKTSLALAMNDYQQSILIDSNFAKSHMNIGVINAKNGDFEAAIRSFQKAINADPNYSLAYFNCATAYKILQEFDKSHDCYSSAIKLEPNNTNYRKFRGVLLTDMNEPQKAIEDFNFLISNSPKEADAYFLRSINLKKLNKFDQAKKDALIAQRLGYKLPEGYLNELK